MTDSDKINRLFDHASDEIVASLNALTKIHGRNTVLLAQACVNCPRILKLAEQSGAPANFIQIIDQQFKMLCGGWIVASKVDENTIWKLAKGINEQMNLCEDDMQEAMNPTGETTKEKGNG